MRIKILICFFISLYSANSAAAEHDEHDLQTLFTDKQQREKIDSLRSGKTVGSEIKKSEEVSVSGYMTRSDGKSVVWVNNKSTLDGSKLDDVTVYQPSIGRDKKVSINVDGKSVRLKPGEIWYKDSGKIVDKR